MQTTIRRVLNSLPPFPISESTHSTLSTEMRPRRLIIGFFALLLLVIYPASRAMATSHDDEHRVYSFMIIGQTAPTEERSRWLTFLEQLAAGTELSFRLQIPSTMGNFESRVLNGDPDFVFVDGYLMTRARNSQGYLPLVRDGKRSTQGVILVRQDSPIKTLKDLEGAPIVFSYPNAFPATLQLRQTLAREHINYLPRFAGNYSNVLRQVLYQEAQAGTATLGVLGRERPEILSQLRILYSAPAVSPPALAVHPRVSLATRRIIEAAILSMTYTFPGRRALDGVELTQPTAANYETDYRPIESIGLAPFVRAGEE
ncbi:hypothetical protein CBW56_03170 [Denitratisoma oestradiolicum]|nr:hypothetical protein CBW56_03170 [Denitratisoma oestradiolicum]